MSAVPAERVDPIAVIRCGCCQERYEDPNDLAVFGTLDMHAGGTWDLCGPCIQAMWRERAPQPEVIPV